MTGNIRILGIDPGLHHTGWGVIEINGHALKPVAAGTITTDPKSETAERLAQLHQELDQVIKEYQPDSAAIEETFVNKNAASSLKLGLARGVAMAAPALHDIPVFEYATNLVKKSVTGAGHADKNQVKTMVKMLLPTASFNSADAADALAVAICHAHHAQTKARRAS